MLRRLGTDAFLVIVDDTVRYSYRPFAPCCLFSVTKSFVAATVGVAVDRGVLDLNDRVAQCLPTDYGFDNSEVTIADLLDMRGGVSESQFQTAVVYYSADLDALMRHVRPSSDRSFAYSNLTTQLLCRAVECRSGTRFDDFFEHNLWQPLSPAHCCRWSLDSERSRTIRAFGGLEMCAADAATLGLLYLNGGVVDGRRLLSESWIDHTINPLCSSTDRHNATYSRHWYVLRSGREFYAKGLFGQFVYVDCDSRTVIVRLGHREGKTDWIEMFRRIALSGTMWSNESDKR